MMRSRSRTSIGSRQAAAYRLADLTYTLAERQGCPVPHKRCYPNRKEAKAALRKLKGAGKPNAVLHAYRCQCGRYHLGRVPSSERLTQIRNDVANREALQLAPLGALGGKDS